MDSNELENQKSMRSFLQIKYTKDMILSLLFVASIIVARAFGFISNDVTGTLFGSVVGFAMGGLRKLHD